MDDSYSCASGGTIRAGIVSGLAGNLVLEGDSITDQSFGVGGYLWGLPLAGSPWPVVSNGAVASTAIQDVIDRWPTSVRAKSPAAALIRIGTNATGLAQATWQAQYDALVALGIADGIKIIFHAVPPRQGTLVPRAMSDYLQAKAAANPGNVYYVEDCTDCGDASYNALMSYLPDGVHPNAKGTHAMGVRMAPLLKAIFAPNDPRIASAADSYFVSPSVPQYVKNPMMSGTPDYWAVSTGGSGTSATASKVAADAGDANQTPWLRTTINSTGADNHWITIETTLAHPALLDDLSDIKRLDVVAEVRLNALAGAGIKNIAMECIDGAVRPSPALSLPVPSDETLTHTMILRQTLPRPAAAHAANTIKFSLSVTAGAALASGVGSLDLRCVSVRGMAS